MKQQKYTKLDSRDNYMQLYNEHTVVWFRTVKQAFRDQRKPQTPGKNERMPPAT